MPEFTDQNDLQLTFKILRIINTYLEFLQSTNQSLLEVVASQFIAKINLQHYIEQEPTMNWQFNMTKFQLLLSSMKQNVTIIIGRKQFRYKESTNYNNYQIQGTFIKNDDLDFIVDETLQEKAYNSFEFSRKQISDEYRDFYQDIDNLSLKKFTLPQSDPFLPTNLQIQTICNYNLSQNEGNHKKLESIYSILQPESGKLTGNEVIPIEPTLEDLKLNFGNLFDLPKEFMTGNIDLCQAREIEAQQEFSPFLIETGVWWKPSKAGRLGNVFIGILIKYETINFQILKSISDYFNLISKDYLPQIKGYEIQFVYTFRGINILSLCWSDKINEFFEQIIEVILTKQIEQETYLHSNMMQTPTEEKIHQHFRQIMQLHRNELNIQQAEFHDIQNVELLECMDIEYLFIGNIIPEQSIPIIQQFETNFHLKKNENIRDFFMKTMNLEGKSLVYALQDDTEKSNYILNFYQGGIRNTKELALLNLITFFLQTQTEEFKVQFSSIGCIDGVMIQQFASQKNPAELNSQIEMFLQYSEQIFQAIKKDEFIKLKDDCQQFLKDNLEQYDSLWEEGRQLWIKIVNRNYDFTWQTKIIDYIDEIKYNEAYHYYNGLFSSQLSGKLSVQIYNSNNTKEEFDIIVQDSLLKEIDNMAQRDEMVIFSLEEAIKNNKNIIKCFYDYNN